MKNLKVWIKLGIGFGLVLSLMCALGLLAIWEFNSQRKSAADISDAYMPELLLAVNFERAAQLTVQNMLRFVDSGEETHYREARKQMDTLSKIAGEGNELVARHPFLQKLADNLKDAQRVFTTYEAAVEKTRTLVLGLNARSQKLQVSADLYFNILHETLTLGENQLEVLITNGGSQEDMLARFRNIKRINDCIDIGNELQSGNMRAQSAGDPDIAFKVLGLFEPMFKNLEGIAANALPQNRERVAKVIELANNYRDEFTMMIKDWRELKTLSEERTKLVSQLLANAQNTASIGISRVQELCAQARDASTESISLLSTGLGFGVLLGLLLSWILTRMITKPLDGTVAFALQVAAGNLDQKLSIEQRDEIGKLAGALNSMVQTLIQRINAANAAMEEANMRKEQATVALGQADEARRMAEQAKRQGMLDAAAQLEGVVSNVSSASEHLSAQVEQSSGGAQEQAARLGETATSMEEMNVSVIEVARNAGVTADVSGQAREKALVGAQVVNKVVDGMSRINTGALELRKDMDILSSKAESIGSILNVISDIADQTNLLALNAAIEAARAGEAGRGFAVVADEVRKLAEKTMQATSEVGTAIRGIQEGTAMNMSKVESTVEIVNEVTGLATSSGQALSEIVTLVDQASEQIRAIAAASDQQSSTSEHINLAITDVNRIATETVITMQEAGRAVNDLTDQANALNRLIKNMKRA